MHVHWTKIAVAALLSATIATQHARAEDIEYSKSKQSVASVTISRLFPKDVPLTLTVKNLDASWQYVTLNHTKPKYDGAPAGVSASIPDAIDRALKVAPDVYLTQWQVASSGNQSFLIAYQVAPMITSEKLRVYLSSLPPLTARFAMRSEYLDFLKTEADTRPLELTLLNLQTIGVANTVKLYDAKSRDDDLLSYIVLSGFRETPNKLDFESMTNLKQLGIALIQYAQEYDEIYPPMQNMYQLKKVMQPYIKDDKVFVQPSNKKFYVPNVALSKMSMARLHYAEKFAAIYEVEVGSDGKRAVAFADGHVKRVTPIEWTKIKKESGIK